MDFMIPAFNEMYEVNPQRAMALYLFYKKLHPSDVCQVVRQSLPVLIGWADEIGMQIPKGVQPIGIAGVVNSGILSTEQIVSFRELCASSDITSLVHLRPEMEMPVGEEHRAVNVDDLLTDTSPSDELSRDPFSAANMASVLNEIDSAVTQRDIIGDNGTIDDLKATLAPKVARYSGAMFDGLNAVLETMQDPTWLRTQRAGELALLFGTVSGRAAELLGNLSGEPSNQQSSRLPQRAAAKRT